MAPSSRMSASSRPPTAPMTLSPCRIASCVAMSPTDPPAPRIKRVSPSATSSWRSTPTAASTEAGSAPASFQVTWGGLRVQAAASAHSPYPPSDGSQAATSSPTATPLTSLPIASTTPVVSNPRTAGSGRGKTALRSPRRIFRSVGPTPETRTLIRTCLSEGSGMGTCVHSRTSGGP